MSFDANLNFVRGSAATAAAFSAQLDIVSSLLVGVVAAIEFGPGMSLRNHEGGAAPYQYISSYHDEVF